MDNLWDNLWIIYGYGWWLTQPSDKYEFVNWDDKKSKLIWTNKSYVPNHQPEVVPPGDDVKKATQDNNKLSFGEDQ